MNYLYQNIFNLEKNIRVIIPSNNTNINNKLLLFKDSQQNIGNTSY